MWPWPCHLGATNLDGTLSINTDAGCIANGEPIGAYGLRPVYENVLPVETILTVCTKR